MACVLAESGSHESHITTGHVGRVKIFLEHLSRRFFIHCYANNSSLVSGFQVPEGNQFLQVAHVCSRKNASCSLEPLLVRDGDFGSGGALVLPTDKVGNLLVLGLLDGALVALVALSEELLLHKVDGWWVHMLAGRNHMHAIS